MEEGAGAGLLTSIVSRILFAVRSQMVSKNSARSFEDVEMVGKHCLKSLALADREDQKGGEKWRRVSAVRGIFERDELFRGWGRAKGCDTMTHVHLLAPFLTATSKACNKV